MTSDAGAQAPEPWAWDEQTWRGHVDLVRAGRALPARNWPGGAEVAVALSFDSDHETIPLRDGHTSPGLMAAGEYGSRVGAPRILDVLRRHDAKATFFMPAVSALLHPDEVRGYVDGGHEMAVHGWIHERNTLLEPATERDLVLRSIDAIERLSGTRPVGIRTPSWDFSPATLSIIREAGLLYDSSLMADDEPYELLDRGAPSGVVEIPVDWIRDDAPYFIMERYSGLRPYTSPRDVLTIWQDEFRGALRDGGLFQLTLHPHIIGHRSRMAVLEQLLEEIGGHRVWFASHEQIARHCLQQAAAADRAGG